MFSFWGWSMGPIGIIVSVALIVVHLAVLVRAITRPDRTSASRIGWVAVILFLPLIGVIAYLFLGETSIGRDRVHKLEAAEQYFRKTDDASVIATDLTEDDETLFRLLHSINGFAPVKGNTVELTKDSDATIASLVADIDAATETVHLSFYIWLDDHNGGLVSDAVIRAAQRGVTCRIVIDALGSRAFVDSDRWKAMKNAGAHTRVALDDIPRIGKVAIRRVDLRNHRKIVVIDDAIAYCGSQNCADPAFLPKKKYAPWVDVFFRCTGPIVAQQQWLFITNWAAESGEELPAAAVRPVLPNDEGMNAAMFGTGPSTRPGDMSDMFTACIAGARRELTISTPYFVPDQGLLAALCAAARRGVRTRLVIPARNDSWFVAQAAYSAYEMMLAAGIELFEYPDGLLHSKTLTVDGRYSLVGSSNMDRRSLELNYENNLFAVDAELAATVLERQETYISLSRQVSLAEVQAWPLSKTLVQKAVSMMAPIL